jgi:hypothetical protein
LLKAIDLLRGPVQLRPHDPPLAPQVTGAGAVELHLLHHMVVTFEQLPAIRRQVSLPIIGPKLSLATDVSAVER